MNNKISLFSQPEYFIDPTNRIKIAASFLQKGSLRLILGAGVSCAFDLPNWEKLVQAIEDNLNISPNPDTSLTDRSSHIIRNHLDSDRPKFSKQVKKALYDNYNHHMEHLTANPLLVAISALSMSGLKGGTSEIITFNFDDILETYLKNHGFRVKSTAQLPRLSETNDVEVYHPHGLLSCTTSEKDSEEIIFTESDFDAITGDRNTMWFQKMTDIMRSNFCLFIGLSGDDPNLRSMLSDTKKHHPLAKKQKYWGFRFSSNNLDPKKEMFEEYGILQITLPHEDIPGWLLKAVQAYT